MAVTNAGSQYIKVPQGALNFTGFGRGSGNALTYVECGSGNSVIVASGGAVTMSAWIYWHGRETAGDNRTGYIISRRDGTDSSYFMLVGHWNKKLKIAGGGGGGDILVSNSDIPIKKWTHVAGTIDNASGKIYIDGELDIAGTCDAPDLFDYSSAALGCRWTGYPKQIWYYSGSMCDVQLWSGVALTDSEIKKVYNGVDVQTDNRVINYKFDERGGTTLENDGKITNDGTIVSGNWEDRDIRCWNTRWDENNYNIVIEGFLDACDRNYLARNITPGAVRELYNILGTPKFIDTTYNSSNSLTFEPLSGYGLSGVRSKKIIAVKNYSDTFINRDTFGIKIEGLDIG